MYNQENNGPEIKPCGTPGAQMKGSFLFGTFVFGLRDTIWAI